MLGGKRGKVTSTWAASLLPLLCGAAMAAVTRAFVPLRSAGQRLSQRLFAPGVCFNRPVRPAALIPLPSAARPSVLQSVRWKSTQPLRSSATIQEQAAVAPIQTQAAASSQSKSRSFPTTTSKSVAYWLLGSAASVFGIVVFGGLTRLTESG